VSVAESRTPVTEIGGDDEERLRVGEVGSEQRAEGLFFRSRDGTNEDRD
jgi:hypothetical protein